MCLVYKVGCFDEGGINFLSLTSRLFWNVPLTKGIHKQNNTQVLCLVYKGGYFYAGGTNFLNLTSR